jgi:hypothetical protein
MTSQVNKRIQDAVNQNSGSGFVSKEPQLADHADGTLKALNYSPPNASQNDKVQKRPTLQKRARGKVFPAVSKLENIGPESLPTHLCYLVYPGQPTSLPVPPKIQDAQRDLEKRNGKKDEVEDEDEEPIAAQRVAGDVRTGDAQRAFVARSAARDEDTAMMDMDEEPIPAQETARPTLARGPALKYVHRACGHDFDAHQEIHVLNLSGHARNVVPSPENSKTMIVMEPRWCSACVQKRSLAISQYFDKLAENETHWDKVDHEIRMQRSRRNGIRRGRIEALSMPLSEHPVGSDKYMRDIMLIFGGLNVTSKVEQLKGQGLSDKMIEMYHSSEEQRAVNEGVIEGREVQGTAEMEYLKAEGELEKLMWLELSTTHLD